MSLVLVLDVLEDSSRQQSTYLIIGAKLNTNVLIYQVKNHNYYIIA